MSVVVVVVVIVVVVESSPLVTSSLDGCFCVSSVCVRLLLQFEGRAGDEDHLLFCDAILCTSFLDRPLRFRAEKI